jgi:hypothetical protein
VIVILVFTRQTDKSGMRNLVLTALCLVLVACGAPPQNPLSTPSADTIAAPADPVLEKLNYYSKNSFQTLSAPIAPAQSLSIDFESTICLPAQAEVIFEGTIDSVNTESLEVVGAQSYIFNLVGSNFVVQACLASGVSALSIRALNSQSVGNANPIQISITTNGNVQTIGRGLVTYPSPGIKASQVVSQTSLGTQNGLSLEDFSVGDVATQTVQSTGNSSLTLETGYINFVRQ